MSNTISAPTTERIFLFKESPDEFVEVDQATYDAVQSGTNTEYILNEVRFRPDTKDDVYSVDVKLGNAKPWHMEALFKLFAELKIE